MRAEFTDSDQTQRCTLSADIPSPPFIRFCLSNPGAQYRERELWHASPLQGSRCGRPPGKRIIPTRRWGCGFAIKPKPPETVTAHAALDPFGSLCFLGDLGKPEIRLSRMCLWGFGVWGALLGVLERGAKLEVDVDGTCSVDPGPRQCNAAPRRVLEP